MDVTSDPPDFSASTPAGKAVGIAPSRADLGDLMIQLAGELDCWSGPTVASALVVVPPPGQVAGEHPAAVMLDLQELGFLDGGGLRALEAVHSELLEAGWLVTARPAQRQVPRGPADGTGGLTEGSSTSLSEVTATADH